MLLIRGGKIKPITGDEIENGELLIGDDGKIAAIGSKVNAPEGVEVLDASGCLVTPGFIDAHCHIGIDEEGVRWEGNDTNEYSSPVTPELRAIDGINPRCEAFANALAGGVTTAVTGPGSANVLGGSFVALKLYGDCVDDMIVKYPAAMKIAFGENPKGCYGQNGKKEPVTRMAIAALLREQLGGYFRTELTRAFGPEPSEFEYRQPLNTSTCASELCGVVLGRPGLLPAIFW